jgi:hypothetical protein
LPVTHPGGGGDGLWIAVAVTGRSPRGEEADIDCGIWWDVLEPNEPVLYASFYDKPKRVLEFTWPDGKQGISSAVRYDRTFLYVPVPKSAEIELPLNRLLDALLPRLA